MILDKTNVKLKYPAFYNINPTFDEFTLFGYNKLGNHFVNHLLEDNHYYLDNYYGRVFSKKLLSQNCPYGYENIMDYYLKDVKEEVVETLRVPFRKIPIYDVSNREKLKKYIAAITKANPTYQVLIRGQSKTYYIEREIEEKILLYGSQYVKEPSFLPSNLRNDFNEIFLNSMWISQASILLNYIMHDVIEGKSESKKKELYELGKYYRQSPVFFSFAIGISQHYGLPSVGLDLTDNLDVGIWFASNNIMINNEGEARSERKEDLSTATVFVFRCPKNAVSSYHQIKPSFIPECRPDKQSAWFGHVGWGESKNQLGEYLVCGFRMNKELINTLPNNYHEILFPKKNDDAILECFYKNSRLDRYEGDAKRALKKIYFFS